MTYSTGTRAAVSLDFLVVGGGLAGLSTAYALVASGHRARVLEKTQGLGIRGGGIRVPPCVSKILMDWGLGPQLEEKGSRCRGTVIHYLKNGELISPLTWQETVIKECGSPFYMMLHQDLYEMLYHLALSVGVQIDLNVEVVSVTVPDQSSSDTDSDSDSTPIYPTTFANERTTSPMYSASTSGGVMPGTNGRVNGASRNESNCSGKPRVTLANGTILEADIIIGADGPHSIVKDVVVEEEADATLEWTGSNCYTGLVPMDEMMSDPGLREIVECGWPMWASDGKSVMGYPIRGDKDYNVHIWWREADPSKEYPEGWALEEPSRVLGVDHMELDPRLRTLFSRMQGLCRMKWREGPGTELEEWVNETQQVVLVGEAAHVMLPAGSHACTLAVEDGAVLGKLFARLKSRDQIGILLNAYQEIQQPRSVLLQNADRSSAGSLLLPEGPATEGRDAMMRLANSQSEDHWDDSELAGAWGDIGAVWGYNAIEAADDWWVQWGLLRERAMGREVNMLGHTLSGLSVTIT
ncbi:FAD/NAD-P-binding domain-containing protein [Stereum hirsutum FP-91666 SS1]|uniref:FAD/NAD-P-binding domain-containing protein n=1 Tax=Stereum hirsutum (strain FP-91666) TaxID=721885 RepID=UPI000444936F|nr:FAD/NAD-P-binding domain-containing protein [Stereum hirsutum FP-91666 SS1]EIM86788.1 FAD/NAD-P-binding domain-containing protein [Stereum hirsutum FP-91666 SS1]